MADGDRQLAFTTGPLPVSVQVSGADKLTPKTVNASFDGTGAAGPFLPCLIIIGRTGHEVARIPAPQVAAGASAEVSWFPRVGGASGGGGSGIQFDTDNEGGWLFVDTHAAISAVDPDYDGKGLALVDGNDDGIVIDSDQAVYVNTVQNGGLVVGQPGNSQFITLNGDVTLDGTFDAGGAQLRGGADGTDPTDFATVGQIGTGGVTDLDGITGSVSLVAGANVSIVDNSPGAGDITISAAGGGGSGGIVQAATVSRTTGDLTTSSTAFVAATGLSLSMGTGAHPCLIIFSASGHSSSGNNVCVDVAVDGARQGGALGLTLIQSTVPDLPNAPLNFTILTAPLAAGTHTFAIQWRVDAHSGTMFASAAVTPAILTVIELGI